MLIVQSRVVWAMKGARSSKRDQVRFCVWRWREEILESVKIMPPVSLLCIGWKLLQVLEYCQARALANPSPRRPRRGALENCDWCPRDRSTVVQL
jgi:hypothetical protein